MTVKIDRFQWNDYQNVHEFKPYTLCTSHFSNLIDKFIGKMFSISENLRRATAAIHADLCAPSDTLHRGNKNIMSCHDNKEIGHTYCYIMML